MRAALVLALAVALTGCGGARGHGTATLWVTRDRGAHVLYAGKVPVGLTAMQALDRRVDLKTRYGGRFVQAIDGVEGDAGKQRDWFYFVNGVEASKGAADVRLRAGDVEWWDYRSWKGGAMSVPVVVGAFPEPFLHGFDWLKPGGCVETSSHADAAVAQHLLAEINGPASASKNTIGCAPSENAIVIDPNSPPRYARATRTGNAFELVVGTAVARRLARDSAVLRYRYGVAG